LLPAPDLEARMAVLQEQLRAIQRAFEKARSGLAEGGEP
jgi:hypothetical protein